MRPYGLRSQNALYSSLMNLQFCYSLFLEIMNNVVFSLISPTTWPHSFVNRDITQRLFISACHNYLYTLDIVRRQLGLKGTRRNTSSYYINKY